MQSFFVSPKFSIIIKELQKLGCDRPSPLKESRPRDSHASEEMRELTLEVVLPFPGGFLFYVICPVDLVELDRALTGDTGGLFHDTKGCLAPG